MFLHQSIEIGWCTILQYQFENINNDNKQIKFGQHSTNECWIFIFRIISGTFVLLWRRGSSVLTAGHLKITRDERFKIVDDYNLQISNVKTQDAGDYICQIGDQETRDQVHTVEILGKWKNMYKYRTEIEFEKRKPFNPALEHRVT